MPEMKRLIRRVREIEIKTRGFVEGLVQGSYYSIFKGRGIEFAEVREYRHGDDVRSIDWNVTARMNRPFVKEFVEERDLTVMIIFDVSGSLNFGTRDVLKKQAAIEFIASIAFSAMKSNDRVALILASDKVEKYVAPRKGRKHVLRIIREMLYVKPKKGGTDLEPALTYASRIMKKRGVVLVVSDFLFNFEKLEKALRALKRKHDVVAVRVFDLREFEIPSVGYVELEDAETGEVVLVNTSDREFRKRFFELVVEREKKIRGFMRFLGIDIVQIPASGDWERVAIRFFKERARRCRR